MTRYLHRIVLIGCVQIILSTGVALATDHKIVEIIRKLLTDSLLRLGYHLIFGMVDPEDHHPFQNRHHLTADGAVDKQTLEALNVPVENRIDQIRINLERTRWVLHTISGQFVIVFIILQPFGLQVVPAPTPQQDTQIIDAYIRQSSG